MNTLQALILGMVQGITEFLPVSSSGHLQLGQYLFGFKNLDRYIFFDVICHLGTLLAIFLCFYKQIYEAISSNRTRFLQILLGTLPLFPLVLLLKPIKALFNAPEYLGFFFLLTALLLYAGIRFGSSTASPSIRKERTWRDPLVIGLFQAVAILPGVSRSGSTISSARLLGWNVQEAIHFSFLLAIPAILGAAVLELYQVLKNPEQIASEVSFVHYAIGFISSFILGYLALKMLQKMAMKHQLIYFVWYCLFLGIFTLYYFNLVAHG